MSIMAIALRRFEEAFGGAYDESDPSDVAALAGLIDQEVRALEDRLADLIAQRTAELEARAR